MRVDIIGAGITGLSVAYFLTRKGHKVRVFDRAPQVGGLAGFFKVDGTYLEKYYHHSFIGHTRLIELVRELNVENEMFFQKVRMGFFHKDHVYPFATAKDLLFFRPLSLHNRVRLGLTSLIMMRIKDWRKLEKRSALEWLRNYSGDKVCEIIWEPLLKMKFGDDFDRISAAWLWNRVVDRKGSKTRGGDKDVLGYIRGGYKTLFDALITSIKTYGGEIITDVGVEEIRVENGRSIGVVTNDRFCKGDVVLSTVPIPSFLRMAPFLPRDYVASLSSIKYQGSICVVLKLTEPLSEYYWINVSDPHCPFVGIIEHTNLVSPKQYGNHNLVYLTKYSSSEDSIFARSDEEIYGDFVPHLKRIFPKFSKTHVKEYWVFKDPFSQPVFVQAYSKIMPQNVTPIKNLYLLNTSQIYPQSRSVNWSIAKAHDLVVDILDNNV